MKTTEITLPEWAFLDGYSHLGDLLSGRTVFQHIRSYTILEIFDDNEVTTVFNAGVKLKQYEYKNSLGITEKHTIVVHFSLAEYEQLDEIIDKAIKFYCDYCTWEDRNINEDLNAINN